MLLLQEEEEEEEEEAEGAESAPVGTAPPKTEVSCGMEVIESERASSALYVPTIPSVDDRLLAPYAGAIAGADNPGAGNVDTPAPTTPTAPAPAAGNR
mmetsp:Transcript_14374/g.23891  ORF Transcript_14374/g.23891 Transcript_14374/m.23891 type:complete len:98 (+) Transcript_14374:589-882(+)